MKIKYIKVKINKKKHTKSKQSYIAKKKKKINKIYWKKKIKNFKGLDLHARI